MSPKIILFISISAIALGACTPMQTPLSTTNTPMPPPPISTPLPTSTNSPTTIPTETITSPPTPQNVQVESAPTLVQIKFQDLNNGWGVASNNGGSIVRTFDGGTTWVNVTPHDLTGIGYSTTLSVLNTDTAWALIANNDFFTGRLFRTSDGGLNWTAFDVPFGGGFIQFLDASTGRALADRGAGAGSQSMEMFQTSDGGATWLSVFNNDPTRPDSSNSLPLSGIKNGMIFLDADTGWVTGTRPVDGEVYLYVTHDGGIDWKMQDIALPTGYESNQYMPQEPILIGNEGFLPLMIFLPNTAVLAFYTSHDGGTTWSGDPRNPNQIVMPGHYAFADARNGWCWDGGNNLYITIDGAQTWSSIPANIDLSERLSQMEFVPGTAGGFLGWVLTSQDNARQTQLYKTFDNGTTWIQVIP